MAELVVPPPGEQAARPYTDTDVELVGHAIYLDDWPDPHIDGWAGSAMSEEYRQNARAALDALAAAGRLLPIEPSRD